MNNRIPESVAAAREALEALEAAQRHRDALKVEFDEAFAVATERCRAKKRTLYREIQVLVRLTSDEAQLKRRLDAATVAATEAEKRYRQAYALALVAS